MLQFCHLLGCPFEARVAGGEKAGRLRRFRQNPCPTGNGSRFSGAARHCFYEGRKRFPFRSAAEAAGGDGILPTKGLRSSTCEINDLNDIIDCIASITIRRLPENTKRRLRIRAARNGRSMEQEARELLETALARAEPMAENLGEAIHRRFAALGGVDLKIPPRGPIRDPGIR